MAGQALSREAPEALAAAYLNDQVPDVEAALAGARDIVAELISDHPDVRRSVREKALRFGTVAAGQDRRRRRRAQRLPALLRL